ncbi:WapI family immunity protein [Massilia sp. TSP1-1-2]|uniref:WapI family immunity protein n=1 Tax=Massilia sp. TSP1-1-2 TaxID=2804649 RepID=UPI003CF099A3
MELSANGFHIHLGAIGPVNDEDWGRVTVAVSEAGFSANFEGWLQSGDVEQFANTMATLYLTAGTPGKAILSCHEPGIYIELESDKHGHVRGRYEFKNEAAGGFNPTLSGILDMDQSYLPAWEKECRHLLVELRG